MHLKFGKITEVDAAKGLARVAFEEDDNLVSAFIPMSVPRSAQDKYSMPFDVNEHVWCMMDEACEDGVIGGAIYDAGNLPVNTAAGNHIVVLDGKLTVKYDRIAQTLSLTGLSGTALNVVIDNTRVELKNGVLIQRGSETLKAIISDLIDQINLIVVPTNVGPSGNPINATAFTAIKTRVANLLK